MQLDCRPARGLDAAEAAARLDGCGPNRLAERVPRPAWRTFLDQFRSVLILILLGAAVLAGAGSDFVFLKADHDVPYGRVMSVMDQIKKAGADKVGMVTRPTGAAPAERRSRTR